MDAARAKKWGCSHSTRRSRIRKTICLTLIPHRRRWSWCQYGQGMAAAVESLAARTLLVRLRLFRLFPCSWLVRWVVLPDLYGSAFMGMGKAEKIWQRLVRSYPSWAGHDSEAGQGCAGWEDHGGCLVGDSSFSAVWCLTHEKIGPP